MEEIAGIEFSKTVQHLWIGFALTFLLALSACWVPTGEGKKLHFRPWLFLFSLLTFLIAGHSVYRVDVADVVTRDELASSSIAVTIQNHVARQILDCVENLDSAQASELELEWNHIVDSLSADWSFAARTSQQFPNCLWLDGLKDRISNLRREIQDQGWTDKDKLKRLLLRAESEFKKKTEIP